MCGCKKFFRTLTIIITYDYNYFYSQTFQTRMLTTRNKKNETITKRKKHWHRWKIEVYIPKFLKDFFFENLKIVWKHFPKKFKKNIFDFFFQNFWNCIFGFDFFCQCWILNVFSTINECIAETINICVYIRIFGAFFSKSLECYYTSAKWILKAPQAPFIIL